MRPRVRRILERRIDELPLTLRTVFVMREVEGMSLREIAECLGVSVATVRSRRIRARALLLTALSREFHGTTKETFGLPSERCDRIVATVLAKLTRGARTR